LAAKGSALNQVTQFLTLPAGFFYPRMGIGVPFFYKLRRHHDEYYYWALLCFIASALSTSACKAKGHTQSESILSFIAATKSGHFDQAQIFSNRIGERYATLFLPGTNEADYGKP
jgi:hypothetical protein